MGKNDIKIDGEYGVGNELLATFDPRDASAAERARNRLVRRGQSRGYTVSTKRIADNAVKATVTGRQPGFGTYKIYENGDTWTAHFVRGDNAAAASARSSMHSRAESRGLRVTTKRTGPGTVVGTVVQR